MRDDLDAPHVCSDEFGVTVGAGDQLAALPCGVRRDPYVGIDRDRVDLINHENKCYDKFVSRQRCGIQTIEREMLNRDEQDGESLPNVVGGWIYYDRWRAGDDYVLHCRRSIGGGVEELLLDENVLGRHRVYLDVADSGVDDRHEMYAWSVDCTGEEAYRIFVKRLDVNAVVDVSPCNCDAEFEWSPDSASLYYGRLDDGGRVASVCRHRLGDDWRTDQVIYHEPDDAYSVGLGRSRCGRWLVIESGGFDGNEAYLLDLESAAGRPVSIRARQSGVDYYADVFGTEIAVVANINEEYQLFRSDARSCPAVDWRLLDVGGDNAMREFMVDDVDAFAGFYVLTERSGPRVRLRAYDYSDRLINELTSPAGSLLTLSESEARPDRRLRIDRTGPVTPEQTLLWGIDANSLTTLWEEDAGPQYCQSDYAHRRVYVRSHDGAIVPITVRFRKSTLQAGGNPCVLDVYGAYEEIDECVFNSDDLGLLDRGIILAVAHVRGGGERGRQWYEQGRREFKINGVIDFVAAARALIEMGVVKSGALAAQSNSAGAIIVGAALNEEPELFAGVVLDVPFVDMLTSLTDDELASTIADRDEFGDPTDEDTGRALTQISPFDNVPRRRLPPLLLTAGLADERVPIREALKYADRVRRRAGATVLLCVDADSGHHGSMARKKQAQAHAVRHAFLLDCVGAEE